MSYPLPPGSPESLAVAKFALLVTNVRQVERGFPCIQVAFMLRDPWFVKDCEHFFFVEDDGKIGPVEKGLLEWMKACEQDPSQIDILMKVLYDQVIIDLINEMAEIWTGGIYGKLPPFLTEDLPFEEAVQKAEVFLISGDPFIWFSIAK